mgnify:CR=1 FL=1
MSQYFDNKNTQFLNPEIKQNGNHMILTNVQKPTQKTILNIDTKFQEEYNNSSYASFTYNLPDKIHDVKSIYVPFMEIPYSFYNFSEQKGNNSFIITDNNSEYILSIPNNQYTASSLIVYIDSLMVGPLASITLSLENNKTKITNSSSDTTYSFSWNVSGNSSDADYDKTKLKSRLGWCLGFREPSYSIAPATEIVSESIVNINTTNYIFLVVDEFSQNHPNSFVSPLSDSYINKNILARLQINNQLQFGKILNGTNQISLLSDNRKYGSKTNIYKLKIQLVDEWGTPIDLNKLDFSFVLVIEHE